MLFHMLRQNSREYRLVNRDQTRMLPWFGRFRQWNWIGSTIVISWLRKGIFTAVTITGRKWWWWCKRTDQSTFPGILSRRGGFQHPRPFRVCSTSHWTTLDSMRIGTSIMLMVLIVYDLRIGNGLCWVVNRRNTAGRTTTVRSCPMSLLSHSFVCLRV